MNHIAKKQMSKALAGFLAIIMMLSLVPAELCATVFAAELSSYAVRVVDEKNRPIEDSVAVTLTNKEDNTKTQTQNTDKGVATFRNFVEEDAVYTVSVSPVTGYETLADYELSVAAGDTMTTVQLTALEKVTISGTVTTVTNKGEKPYEGAKVTLSGYLTAETTTGRDGRYSFEVFKGQDYTVTAVANDPKYDQPSSKFAAISGDTDCPLQFNIRSFTIKTKADENGTITGNMSVQYGESATVEAVADDGYCIDKFTVDGVSQTNATGEKSYSYSFENVQDGHEVSVTFIRQTYKITFTVDKNGEVTYGEGDDDKVAGGSVNVEKVFEESTDPENPTKVEVTATPAENYRVSQVTIDGGKPEKLNKNNKVYTHTFEMNRDHSFSVVFSPNTYTVTVKAGYGGNAGVDNATVEHGGSATVTITPDKEYNIKSVTVNDAFANYEMNEDGKSYSLKLENITKDQNVQVEFSRMETIEGDYYSFNSGDAILTEKTDQYYKYVFDKNATVTFKPSEGYDRISVNDKMGKEWNSYSIDRSEEISEIAVFSFEDMRWYNVKLPAPKIIIVIDKEAPVITSADVWSQPDKDVTISGTAGDADSPLDCIVWATAPLTEAQVLNIAAGGETPEGVTAGKTGIEPESGTYSFNVKAGTENATYYIYAVDKAHNVSKAETTTVQIDGTAPAIIKFEFEKVEQSGIEKVLNVLSFGIFFNEEVKVTVTASDSQSGVKSITLYGNNDAAITLDANDDGEATFVLPAEQTELVDGEVYFNGTISATAADNVGNAIEEPVTANKDNSNNDSGYLMIETVKPTVTITPVNPIYTAGGDETTSEKIWYKGDEFNFEIDVKDEESGIKSVEIQINDNEIPEERYIEEEKVTEGEKVTERKITVSSGSEALGDGTYKVHVIVTDNAGNVGVSNDKTVYRDTTAPQITGFKFNDSDSRNGLAQNDGYAFYFNAGTEVTIYAKDEGVSAGIKSITYYMVDIDTGNTSEVTADATVTESGEYAVSFKIEEDFKGQIYAKATDNVGNTPESFVNPDGVILEKQDKHDQEKHIAFERAATSYQTENGDALYAEKVDVTITVTDTYSGIGSVEWFVDAPFDTGNNQKGHVDVRNDAKIVNDKGNEVKDWTVTGTDKNLVTKMQKTITVTNDSNDIRVEVKLTDRAGNTTTESIKFSIDKTAPKIEVSYDKNAADEKYASFFKDARTATVKITERNFNENDVVYNIENPDGVIPVLSQWTKHDVEKGQDPNGTYYTATIVYEADGDYTFDIRYTDRAGNAAEAFAPHQFTIDRTLPTVSVSYDNMAALNGNYYSADRTATITIVEHNFDPDRVRVRGTAADNGAAVAFPAISAWTNNGDVHTATIHYGADARYIFDIEFMDKAGNSIADYTPEEFYVDKTAPTLEIGGVADRSANNGTVAPFITFTDTNYNPNAITYTLVGVNNGTVTYASSLADVANGQTVTFADFERVQQVDDIYTLTATMTDMAGNESTASITFSANRFGSVYDLSAMQKQNGKYLQTEEDIVFTEVNVDTLKSGETKIKLTKNGTPRDLVEGKDYTIAVSGGNGQWSQYVYTISKSLFADDGRYSISVYSVDAAGNINENIDETKNAEISFGIDKTKPVIVPIDFESNTQYPVEVKTVSVEIKDNLVLEGVKIYLNGAEIQYTNDGETYTFDIPEMNEKQNVRIVAVDAAGNEYELSVEDFLVSTNVFVRWYNNTPLFVGSIVGIAVVCGFLIIVMLKRKKKTSEE